MTSVECREGKRVAPPLMNENNRYFRCFTHQVELVLERTYVGGFTEPLFLPHYVNRRTMLDGSSVKSAKPQTDMFGRFEIALTFSAAGAKEFTELTRNYAARGPENPSDWGRQLAIIIDDILYTSPLK